MANIAIMLGLAILPAVAIMAAVRDITTMTIPNWMSLALAVTFVPVALICGLGLTEILVHLGVGVAALVLGIGLFALRLIGGGDAKLMAALALWLGLSGAPAFIFWTALAGGAFSLLLLVARPRAHVLAGRGPAWFGRLMTPEGDIPYGVAIAVGALMAYPASPLAAAAF